ncbi:MAG: hypothetical protein HY765_08755 [Rhodomicrobium sp.]|nr:hypothetical protein [Rhodomicrobium sp.]
MNTRRSQLYLAHTCSPDGGREGGDDVDGYIAEMQPEEAAEYIASLLCSLRVIASNAHLRLLSDLLSVAEEEAKLQRGT